MDLVERARPLMQCRCIVEMGPGMSLSCTLNHQTFQVPKMEESKHLYKLYGYGLWIRENPLQKWHYKVQYLHFRYLKFLVNKQPVLNGCLMFG